MSLPEVCVRRPVAVFVCTLAVTVFGFLAARQLSVDLLPDLSYPTLTIQTVYPDAAPVSVEQLVTRPVEEAVGVIPGVRDMRSTSRAGLSEVVLEFEWDEDMDVAALDVREKLGLVELPREADLPRVLRFDPSLDPVMRVSLTGERPLDDLRQIADRFVKPRLEAVRGIAAAKVRGGLDPEIQVEADEDRLAAYGLTLADLGQALERENVNRPGGTLKDWGAVYLVRTLNEFDDLRQIRRTVVRDAPAGRVRVEDVAEVSRGHRDREEITRAGGRETVELALHREGSANTVAVASAAREEIGRLNEELGRGLRLEILTDQSRYIAEAISQVWSAAALGGILAVLVLYFFLRDPRPTGIVALNIPISVLATFLPMRRAGVDLNLMSLGGLALGVGMLVDNSIVVLEAIDRRRREGRSRREAAVAGAGEVAAAVTSSTLTTVAVFFPIVFVKGIAGQLFYDLAVTVCVSLAASLAVSLTLTPALAALEPGGGHRSVFRWDEAREASQGPGRRALGFALRGPRRGGPRVLRALGFVLLLPVRALALVAAGGLVPLQKGADLAFPWLEGARLGRLRLPPLGDPVHPTTRLLTLALSPVRLVALAAAGVAGLLWLAARRAFEVVTAPLWASFQAFGTRYPAGLAWSLRHRGAVIGAALAAFVVALAAVPVLGTELVPDLLQGEFAFRLRLPEGTPLETTAQVVERIEAPLVADGRFARVFSVVGSLPSAASGRRTLGENLAQIDFALPAGAGAEDEEAAVGRVRRVLDLFPEVEAELVHPSVLTMKPPVVAQVFADDLAVLDRTAEQVAAALRRVPEVDDVATTVEFGSPEIRVEIDRERAGALRVQPDEVSQSLRRQIRGEIVGQFREEEERLDIRLRASEPWRARASEVESLRIRLAGGAVVPVSAVARVVVDRGPAAIHRSGGARVAEVSGKTPAADLGRALDRVRAVLGRVDLPSGATVELAGQDRELHVSFSSLRLALALALFLVYVVMAAQFESLLHPFVILLTVPLGATGALGALLVTGRAISVLALIGIVMLAGIVVNNAIVLVDAVNRRRGEGQALEQAIVGAGRERLRPIVMTTATTVLGLLPMALGLGAGDELRAPLAITVIGGLTLATLLTLIVIPCVYRSLARGEARPAAAIGEAVALGQEAGR
jgi:HAE1 family hydrophobic/amphiphilic exporter-1